MQDFFETVAALRRGGQSFATATVVGRRAPVSAHLGDRAIVFADGRMEGFIGGACSREIIRKQSLDALRTRRSRLVSIRPDAAAANTDDPEHVVVPMTCVSEGAVEVYVEPFVPARTLVVVGMTPVADALARTGASLHYDVVRVVDTHEQRDAEASSGAAGIRVATLDTLESVLRSSGPDAAVVVSSQGHYDEQALESVLKQGASYVGLVASRQRGAAVREYLKKHGLSGVDAIRNPAGLDLGARTAPEVAVSILAEIVQTRSAQPGARLEPAVAATAASAGSAMAVDPVCKMDVDPSTARHRADANGATYYFCCAQCRTRFIEDPARYLASPA
jgi:xanthine dehydrogenase accessory factor